MATNNFLFLNSRGVSYVTPMLHNNYELQNTPSLRTRLGSIRLLYTKRVERRIKNEVKYIAALGCA